MGEQYTIFLNTKASEGTGVKGSSNTRANKMRCMVKACPFGINEHASTGWGGRQKVGWVSNPEWLIEKISKRCAKCLEALLFQHLADNFRHFEFCIPTQHLICFSRVSSTYRYVCGSHVLFRLPNVSHPIKI